MKVVRDAAELAEALAAARREATRVVRQRLAVRRAADRATAPRRDPGLRRQARAHRAPLRARVLGAAPPSEGDRRKSVPGAQRRRFASGWARRPLPPRRRSAIATPARANSCSKASGDAAQLLFSRDEHAPAGRASRHRMRRRASIWFTRNCASRRVSRCPSRRRACRSAATRSSAASTRRIRRRASFRRRDRFCSTASRRDRAFASTAASRKGSDVSVHYDPMLAKLIVHASTREEARRRAITALRDYAILGIRTNIPFLLQILEHPQFVDGVDRHRLPRSRRRRARGRRFRPSCRAAVARRRSKHAPNLGTARHRQDPQAPAADPFETLGGWRG